MLLANCRDGCGRELVQSLPSPDGKLRATVFSGSCGATTPYSVQVYVGGSDDKPEDGVCVFQGTHSKDIAVTWKGDNALVIQTDARTSLLMKEYSRITTFEKIDSKPVK